MVRVFFIRLLLVALPFIVWFAWAEIARRRGNPMGSTPWAWLLATGLVLFAASFIVGALLTPGIDPNATYVPVERGPGGEVIPGPR